MELLTASRLPRRGVQPPTTTIERTAAPGYRDTVDLNRVDEMLPPRDILAVGGPGSGQTLGDGCIRVGGRRGGFASARAEQDGRKGEQKDGFDGKNHALNLAEPRG